MAAFKSMTVMELKQRLLVMLNSQLVLSVINYVLGVLTLSGSQCEWLDHIQNEVMRTTLGCLRDTSITMRKYILRLPYIRSRIKLAQVKAYMCMVGNSHHPLQWHISVAKGSGITRSWTAEAEANNNNVTAIKNILRGAERIESDRNLTMVTTSTHQQVISCDGCDWFKFSMESKWAA